jgi:hypothetical protein
LQVVEFFGVFRAGGRGEIVVVVDDKQRTPGRTMVWYHGGRIGYRGRGTVRRTGLGRKVWWWWDSHGGRLSQWEIMLCLILFGEYKENSPK